MEQNQNQNLQTEELTQQKLYELSKQFLSKSMQIQDSDVDTDGSTRGTSIKSQFMDQFPDIINKHQKLKQEKSSFASTAEKKKSKRRSSVTEFPVLEENNEYEDEEQDEKSGTNSIKFQILQIKDHHSKFSDKLNQIFDEKSGWENLTSRKRTISVDKLPKVLEEVEEQDDYEFKRRDSNSQSLKIDLLTDQNEFNSGRRISQKKISMNLSMQNQTETIQEENETDQNINGCEQKSKKSVFLGANNEANVNSPRYRLRVDELDSQNVREHRENSFNFNQEQKNMIEAIEEEGEKEQQDQDQTEAEKKFEHSKNNKIFKQFGHSIEKLHKELHQIKQEIQGEEPIKQQEIESMGQIQEIEDSSDEENGLKLKKQNSKKRSSVQDL